MNEEIERQDYFSSFVRLVIRDLKANKTACIFNQEQYDEISKYLDIEETKRDDLCIWIRLKNIVRRR